MSFFRHTLEGRCAQAILLAVLVSGLSAQISETRARIGVPDDWTHHRMKFNSALLRQRPELAAGEPRAAMQLYREAFQQAQAAMTRSLAAPSSLLTSSASPHRDWSISLGTGRLQPGQFPAKWQADPTLAPSCTADFVIYALNVTGTTGGQPSIVGLNRLYSDGANPLCGGFAQPNFLFSYNTTTLANGRILTSPVLSLDGKKVAFIETQSAAGPKTSVLHVLTIPTSGTQATVTPSHAVPGGAMLNLTIGGNGNSRSSPWIDYKNDVIYVGLDDGRLYKITGVFNGTPALAGAPWPILINNNSTLTSPLLDVNTGKLFIGAGNGRVYSVNVNTPAGVTAIQVGRTGATNPTIYDSPLFDATAGSVFVVTSNDNVLPGASVAQINATTFAVTTRVPIGLGSNGGTAVNLYDGDFDNNYYNSPATGHMVLCGTGAANTNPFLYILDFNGSGTIQTGATAPVQLSTNAAARCGPVTEFFNSNINGGTDFHFWGVNRNCPGFGNAGCVMSLTNETFPVQSAQSAGGTSAIVIDNNYVTLTGGSSIYFSTGGAPNSAVKVTQQGLQ